MSFEIIHYVKKKWIKHGMYCVNCTVLNLHYNSLGKKYLCNWDYNLLLRCEGNSCSTAASALPQAETDVSQSKNGAGSVVTLRSKPWRKPGLCTRHETRSFLFFWNAQFRYSRKEIKNLKTKRILWQEQRAQLAVGHEDTVHEDKIIHCWVWHTRRSRVSSKKRADI